jgi:hypothetical protein
MRLAVLCCAVLYCCGCSADSPVWVLRHNVTVANRLAPIPPLPPPPPLLADPVAEAGRLRLVELSQRIARSRSYDWWMYDCIGGQPSGRPGRPCSELQEGAIAKSATFFATENALPTEHGQPKVGTTSAQCWARAGTSRRVLDLGRTNTSCHIMRHLVCVRC